MLLATWLASDAPTPSALAPEDESCRHTKSASLVLLLLLQAATILHAILSCMRVAPCLLIFALLVALTCLPLLCSTTPKSPLLCSALTTHHHP